MLQANTHTVRDNASELHEPLQCAPANSLPARIDAPPESPCRDRRDSTGMLYARPQLLNIPHRAAAQSKLMLDVNADIGAVALLQEKLCDEVRVRQCIENQLSDATAALARARAELLDKQLNEKRLMRLALHDCLTMLPNRRFFHWRLEQALINDDTDSSNRRSPIVVIQIILDQAVLFGQLNDRSISDQLINVTAARITRIAKPEDLVARLTENEFACVLFSCLNRECLDEFVVKLWEAVTAPVRIAKRKISLKPSMGIAIGAVGTETAASLMDGADGAMHRAALHHCGFSYAHESQLPASKRKPLLRSTPRGDASSAMRSMA